MSRKTKRKQVIKEVFLDNLSLPDANQTIVQILGTKGNNLHEVLTPTEETYLASMPTKFRKNIWVKRGSYVLVEPIKEGKKVKAEIVRILTKDHLKYYKKEKIWPSAFGGEEVAKPCVVGLVRNVNQMILKDEDAQSDYYSDVSRDDTSDDSSDDTSDNSSDENNIANP